MTKIEKIFLLINILQWGLLAVFSYAYVDLNLTLAQNRFALSFISALQQLGYFHRPEATLIYICAIIFAFSFFILNLFLFSKSKISLHYLKVATLTNTLILIFAYPFLSSDLFNYMFDAKIITTYHLNPYDYRPLDFPADPWIRFMRWTHRYSPYGPVWLAASIVPSILGFGKFTITLFLFKIFIASFHLFNSYLIYKILKKIKPKILLLGTGFYALNPLFLIEGVANAHNDVILATSLIIPVYFIVAKKRLYAFPALFLGALLKYISVLIIPWLISHVFLKYPKNLQSVIYLNLATLAAFTFIFSTLRITVPFVSSGATQTQFQPWYLFWTLPLLSLVPNLYLIAIGTSVSIGAVFRYLPFLYYGDWSHPGTISYLKIITIISFVVALAFITLSRFFPKK